MKNLLPLFLFALLISAFSKNASAKLEDTDFRDWRMTCDTESKDKNFCTIHESLYKRINGKKVLVLRLMLNYSPNDNRNFMKIVSPIDAWLKPGINLEIGTEQNGLSLTSIPFDTCEGDMCFIDAFLSPEIIETMKTSITGNIKYMTRERKSTSGTFSLYGFKEAYEAMIEKVNNKK